MTTIIIETDCERFGCLWVEHFCHNARGAFFVYICQRCGTTRGPIKLRAEVPND